MPRSQRGSNKCDDANWGFKSWGIFAFLLHLFRYFSNFPITDIFYFFYTDILILNSSLSPPHIEQSTYTPLQDQHALVNAPLDNNTIIKLPYKHYFRIEIQITALMSYFANQ